MHSEDCLRGYEAALTEIYAAIESEDHPRNCGDCRACGVIRAAIESCFSELARLLPLKDFIELARMINRLNQ